MKASRRPAKSRKRTVGQLATLTRSIRPIARTPPAKIVDDDAAQAMRRPNPLGQSFYRRQPFKLRFWRALGFREAHAPRPATPEFTEGYAEGWFQVASVVMFSFRERLMILISGKIMIDQAVKTESPVGRHYTTCSSSILRPGWTPPVHGYGEFQAPATTDKAP